MRGDIKLRLRGSVFWYRFLDGKLYRGSTETSDLKKAEKILKVKRDELGAARKLYAPIISERDRKTSMG